MAIKVSQKVKSTKPKVGKVSSAGAGRTVKQATHLSSHTNPTTPKKGGGRGKPVGNVNPMPSIVEYKNEGKNKHPFGAGVKHV